MYVSSDQLVGGPWPDNYPSVSSLDWQNGEPNAKYWAVRLLAAVFGTRTRQLVVTNASSTDVHAIGFVQDGQKGILILSKGSNAVTLSVPQVTRGWEGTLLEGVGAEPGFTPPRAVQLPALAPGQEAADENSIDITVGAYAVLVLWQRPPTVR